MAKTYTVAQARRAVRDINAKAMRLYEFAKNSRQYGNCFSTQDLLAIDKLMAKVAKKL